MRVKPPVPDILPAKIAPAPFWIVKVPDPKVTKDPDAPVKLADVMLLLFKLAVAPAAIVREVAVPNAAVDPAVSVPPVTVVAPV